MNIQAKFILMTLALALGSLAVIGTTTYRSGREAIGTGIGSAYQRAARGTVDQIDRELLAAMANVKTWAQLDIMQDVLAGDVDGTVSTFLMGLAGQCKEIASIDALNAEGEVVASSSPALFEKNFSKEEFFRKSMEKKPYWLDASIDQLDETWVVLFAHPIFAKSDENRVIGVLRARWRVDALADEIRFRGDSVSSLTGRALVLRRDGLVLAAPEYPDTARGQNIIAAGRMSARFASEGREGHLVETDKDGRQIVVGYSFSKGRPDSPVFGWIVLVEGDAKAVFAPIYRLRALVLLVGGATVAVIFVLSTLLTKRLMDPICQVSEAAVRVADGDFDVSIDCPTRDEVGGLTRAFNKMVWDLKAQRAQLLHNKEYIQAVVANVANPLIVTDSDGRIQTVNGAALALFGYTEQDLIGQPIAKIVGELGSDFWDSPMGRRLQADSVSRRDVKCVCRDGRELPTSFSGGVMRDTDGRAQAVVCVFEDLTERKRAEREREELSKKLLDASRLAGMAEVATSVLHNVGNVLNSINISATVVSERVNKSPVNNLAKVAALLKVHAHDPGDFLTSDPKGRHLLGYMLALAEYVTKEKSEILKEMASLTKNVDHIKNIVSMQQSYAKVAGVRETLAVTDLLEDAVRLNEAALDRHGVKVVRKYERVPTVCVERHKVLQILVNLLRNAKHALTDSQRPDKQLMLRVGLNGNNSVKVCVIDNGVGISAENLTRIFEHGFTTRKDGHGFGLHSGALAAKGMGGALMAHSDGPGQGARFTLELPVEHEPK